MDAFLAHLRVLDGILEKKAGALSQILNITENLRIVLSSKNQAGTGTLIAGMNEEKLKLIKAVNEGDKVFERIFSEISSRFEPEARGYPELVASIQARIKHITTLDVRIRVMESRSKDARIVNPGNMALMKRAARSYEQSKKFSKQPPG